MAVKLVIEPIFEADFHDCSFGFRPNRGAQDAAERIAEKVKVRDRLYGTGKRYLHFGPSMKSVKRLCREVHGHTHTRNVLLPVETVVERVNRLLKGWGGFYTVGYPSRVFRKVNHYVLKESTYRR